MKHLFGPVNSRRLGLSLGIDLLPAKICNFNCIYCEVGPNVLFTDKRQEYIPTVAIINEIDIFLSEKNKLQSLDIFTITASGEPTLHSGIGEIIQHLKSHTDKPVAVLTNGSLLHLASVREALLPADIIVPSLDAVVPQSFRKINRPFSGMHPDKIVDGLIKFKKEYKGKLWLEILLAKNINDSEKDIDTLNKAIQLIDPDRIQLNTVIRPPLETFARPLTKTELTAVAGKLYGSVEIIADFNRTEKEKNTRPSIGMDEVLSLLHRRPCTLHDICEALNQEPDSIGDKLAQLEQSNLIAIKKHNGKEYYKSRK